MTNCTSWISFQVFSLLLFFPAAFMPPADLGCWKLVAGEACISISKCKCLRFQATACFSTRRKERKEVATEGRYLGCHYCRGIKSIYLFAIKHSLPLCMVNEVVFIQYILSIALNRICSMISCTYTCLSMFCWRFLLPAFWFGVY